MATVAVSSRSVDHGHQSTSCTKSSAPVKSTQRADRFYGHRATAELCEQFILYLFACPLDSTSASVGSPSQSTVATPRLSEFIAYALYRTRLPEVVTYQALYLLLRLKIRFPAARGSSGHRLFISALMLASKSSCDDTYSNKSWTIVGQGLFSLREINQMERELFGYLGYKVNVEPRELELFSYDLQTATDVGQFDYIVRGILEGSSRRDSLELGSNSPPLAAASPAVPSIAEVEIGSPSSSANLPVPKSTQMVKSASCRFDQPNYNAAPPTFIHPFVQNARDRCRPYSMPVQSSTPNTAERAYANSPAASACSSMSYTHSASSAMSATPSPCASRYTISGRTTPNTPPSDIDSSHWDDTYYYSSSAGVDSKTIASGMVSPMTTTVDMKHSVYPKQRSVGDYVPSYVYNNWRP